MNKTIKLECRLRCQGNQETFLLTGEEKRDVALHEATHAGCATLLTHPKTVDKVIMKFFIIIFNEPRKMPLTQLNHKLCPSRTTRS